MIFLAPFTEGMDGASKAPHRILAERNGNGIYHEKIAEIPIHRKNAETTSDNIASILSSFSNYVVLGGDHSISHGIVRARKKTHLVLFDAHTDDYINKQTEKTHPLHHGNWVRKAVEGGFVTGVTMFDGGRSTVPAKYKKPIPKSGNIHVSVDVDVLSVGSFGTATGYPELGGYTVEQLVEKISAIKSKAEFTADIVEYNPDKDATGVGAWCCSKILDVLLELTKLH